MVLHSLSVHRPGALKAEPFTVLVVANPILEAPLDTGQLIADPISSDAGGFARAVSYIKRAIFGQLPDQAEQLLGDPQLEPDVRFSSLFEPALAGSGNPLDHAFVAQDSLSTMLVARRKAIRDFLLAHQLVADVVYAVSGSASHTRASAWHTTDDDSGPGDPFVLDGVTLHHRHRYLIPGTIAIHKTATSLTAAHELSHALSSYSNGKIVDLYVDGGPALNSKRGRPIPPSFATYGGQQIASGNRGDLGYPGQWQSYHCELSTSDGAFPALMDNYWAAPTPAACQHDVITRRFLRDRVLAKMRRL